MSSLPLLLLWSKKKKKVVLLQMFILYRVVIHLLLYPFLLFRKCLHLLFSFGTRQQFVSRLKALSSEATGSLLCCDCCVTSFVVSADFALKNESQIFKGMLKQHCASFDPNLSVLCYLVCSLGEYPADTALSQVLVTGPAWTENHLPLFFL